VAVLLGSLCGLAVLGWAAAGTAVAVPHIYWPNGGTIGEAILDGTSVEPSFITGSTPVAVAVDGQHIYWATDEGSIGRANLDSTDANPGFITGATGEFGVAVNGQHIYWTNGESIGEANLDGTGVNQSVISTGNLAVGVEVVRDLVEL
jgi:hypothetical protein